MVEQRIKRIYRSRDDRVLGGVAGGVGKYLNIDPSIIRILWVLLTIISMGLGILLYLVAWIVFPLEPEKRA